MNAWVIYFFHTKNLKNRSKNATHANFPLEDNTLACALILTKSQSMKRRYLKKVKPWLHYSGNREHKNLFSYWNDSPSELCFSLLCLTFGSTNSLAGNQKKKKKKKPTLKKSEGGIYLLIVHTIKSENNQCNIIKPRIGIMFSSLSLLDYSQITEKEANFNLLWVLWSDTLSGCLANGNRRKH